MNHATARTACPPQSLRGVTQTRASDLISRLATGLCGAIKTSTRSTGTGMHQNS